MFIPKNFMDGGIVNLSAAHFMSLQITCLDVIKFT